MATDTRGPVRRLVEEAIEQGSKLKAWEDAISRGWRDMESYREDVTKANDLRARAAALDATLHPQPDAPITQEALEQAGWDVEGEEDGTIWAMLTAGRVLFEAFITLGKVDVQINAGFNTIPLPHIKTMDDLTRLVELLAGPQEG